MDYCSTNDMPGHGRERCFFKRDFTADAKTTVNTDPQSSEVPKRERYLICKLCKNIITSHLDIIEMNGRHSHTFQNPKGIVFHIGCFNSARGCLIFGDPTFEYTWFPGFSWCFALCSNCMTHLGWYYHSGSGGFFGLILDQLCENEY